MAPRCAWQTRLPGGFYAGTLGFTSGRIHCCVVQDNQRSVVAFQDDGTQVWSYSYPPKQHTVSHGVGEIIFLDGRKTAALAPADGALLASRDFDLKLSHAGEAVTGPVFFLGPPATAVGYIGLHPITLATLWEWPELEAEVRGSWIRGVPTHGVAKFLRLPQLTTHELSVATLPRGRGRRIVFAAGPSVWCQFDERSAAGMALPSGTLVWTREETAGGHHEILWSTDTIAYGGSEEFSAYDLATGRVLWRRRVDGGSATETAHTQKVGYLITRKRTVVRVTLSDGEVSGAFDAPAEVLDAVAIDDSTIVLATAEALVCGRFD